MKFNADPAVGSGGEFLKLKGGQSIVGVFRGSPHEFFVKWNGKNSQPCPASDPECKFRFRVNFVVNESGSYKAYIWEQGATVYNLMKTLNADFPLDRNVVKITRVGSTMNDTEYHILPTPNGAVDDAKNAMLNTLELQDLKAGLNVPEPGAVQGTGVSAHDEIPF